MVEKLLTSREVATLCNVTPETVASWRQRRMRTRPQPVRIGSRGVRYRAHDVQKFLERESAVRPYGRKPAK